VVGVTLVEVKNKFMLKRYIFNILISFDQFINTIFGGDPDMTISARLHRNYCGHPFEKFVDWLFAWQKRPGGHCENSDWWEQDEGKDSIFK
jgi:hypothetical protein